jgi:hypothetical protein
VAINGVGGKSDFDPDEYEGEDEIEGEMQWGLDDEDWNLGEEDWNMDEDEEHEEEHEEDPDVPLPSDVEGDSEPEDILINRRHRSVSVLSYYLVKLMPVRASVMWKRFLMMMMMLKMQGHRHLDVYKNCMQR